MLRTNTCGELTPAAAGKHVTLAGWVHRRRDLGGLTFIDLRDRWGITQIVAKSGDAVHDALGDVRNEWVLQITGTVRERSAETVNQKLPTGGIEVAAETVTVRLTLHADVLQVRIADDGRGFELEAALTRARRTNHLGLESLMERVDAAGGTVQITTAPGAGTVADIALPLWPDD